MQEIPRSVSVVIVGAGNRGSIYASFAQIHPERLRVVGVAEPRDYYRQRLVKTYAISPENAFSDWQDLARRPRLADAVIIATPDIMHVEPATAFANLGYAMLLEKPLAPTAEDCRRIIATVKAKDTLFAVCHVMRYSPYTQMLKRMVDSGMIGEVVTIQHLEPVGYWHQVHSYVRGKWRSEKESSPMLLAKSCHDLDWIRYVVGTKCSAVSSFGSLKHFRRSEKPVAAGEAKRCVDCNYESQCPYSAKRIYLGRFLQGETGWPVEAVVPNPTAESLSSALQTGPYGRCVYECDNDVVDNQVVNLIFAGQQTATLTMTGFNQYGYRKTRIFGTRGELYGDGVKIDHYDFLTDQTRTLAVQASESAIMNRHGGGDYGLMKNFVAAVAADDPRQILSGPDESLETHLMVFAAEKARHEQAVVRLEVD